MAPSDEDIDRLILSFATDRFRKVAMVLGQVFIYCRDHGLELSEDALGDRLHALVDAGRLEAQGNLFRWRWSEVRLPEHAPANPDLEAEPETRRYVVPVMTVFLASATEPKEFDVWENVVVVRAKGPRRALTQAVAMTRSVLDHPENTRALGYPETPCLYAVRSHCEFVDLPNGGATYGDDHMTLTWLTGLGESDFEKLKSYDEVSRPLQALYIDSHFD